MFPQSFRTGPRSERDRTTCKIRLLQPLFYCCLRCWRCFFCQGGARLEEEDNLLDWRYEQEDPAATPQPPRQPMRLVV
ncbi:unnamed protein product [Amoebophrya sp. A25]|nr:unnamed protein product [Amoebophrya sp. A25]|eukprot:GSA25T00014946001.1